MQERKSIQELGREWAKEQGIATGLLIAVHALQFQLLDAKQAMLRGELTTQECDGINKYVKFTADMLENEKKESDRRMWTITNDLANKPL